MFDDKRMPTRVSVPTRAPREIEAYGRNAGGGGDGGSGDMAATNLLAAIWRRRGVVIACVLLALVCGAVWLMRAVPIYSSTAQVLVQQSSTKYASDEMTYAGQSATYLSTQCQLITSTAILSQALDQPGVADVSVLKQSNPEGSLNILRNTVTAVASKTADIIYVTMESTNFQDAATVVNGVVAAYQQYQARQHVTSAAEVTKIITNEMDSVLRGQKVTQQKMFDLRKANPELGLTTNKGQQVNSLLGQQTAELSVVSLRADDLHLAVKTIDATDPGNLGGLHQVVNQYDLAKDMPPSNMGQVAQNFAEAKARKQMMEDANMGAGNPLVQRANAMYDRAAGEMQAAQRDDGQQCLGTVHTAAAVADRRVKQLQEAIAQQRLLTTGLNMQEAEYEALASDAARAERSIDSLNDHLRKIASVADVTPMTLTVLETAKPNPNRVKPKPSQILALAGAAGLMAGMGLALLFDKMDQRLRSVEEIATLLDATVLGVVPRIVRRVLPTEAGREIALMPRSGVAEAFRTIRTAIYFGGADRAGKTILVTSPTPGDGKSTCISNLAIAMAQGGRRTLLIDADCRRPVQHKTFSLDEGPGLSSVLTGTATLDEALRKTEITRLDVLPCGPLPHNPAELLDSQALLDLLAEVGRRYDQVLIDSPPVTLVSDARVLAASCDAAFLVLRHEKSTRKGAQLAWNALSSVGANLLGVVVNDLSRQKEGYGYSYYGYGRYGYAPAAATAGELPGGNGSAATVNGHGQAVGSAAD